MIPGDVRLLGERLLHDRPRAPYVYLGALSSQPLYKIGFSTNPRKRQAELRSEYCDPWFEMRWHALGGPELEQRLHEYFADIRIGARELFDFTGRDPLAEVQQAYNLLRSNR